MIKHTVMRILNEELTRAKKMKILAIDHQDLQAKLKASEIIEIIERIIRKIQDLA
jgi:hypothetical protein